MGDHLRIQVEDQVHNVANGWTKGDEGVRFWNRVWDQIGNPMWDQVWDQVDGRVMDHIRDYEDSR